MGTKRPHTHLQSENIKKFKIAGHWALGLLETMKDPESVVEEDDLVVVIKDKYPKAEFHYLVIPKEDISSLKQVNKNHISLLQHMQEVAQNIIKEEQHKHRTFKIGYHAEASMVRLHLHVISNDLISNCLKTKKHWNSYASDFFLNSKEICAELIEKGTIALPSSETCKKLLNTPLKCHMCEYIPKHMPNLKEHLATHLK